MPDRRASTEAFRQAALAVSTAEGEGVFEQLVASLARILGVEFALISVYVEPQRTHLRTLATFFDGRLAKNIEYPVAGTPCEQAIGRSFGHFPKGVARRFPTDGVLMKYSIEAYAATTLHDAGGAPIGALTVMSRREIADGTLTEAVLNIFAARVSAEIGRRRSETGLRASEEQYRAIFNATTDSLTLRDADFRIVDVNPAYERMSGLRRADVLGMQELTMHLLDVRDWRHEVHDRALAGESVRVESEARRRDGSRFRLEVLVLPMQYRGAPHALYVARDITERQQAEAALRTSEEQYRSIFNATADALVLRDAQFRIVDVNAAYESMSGRRRDTVVGLTDLTLTRNARIVDRRRLHLEALAGRPVHFEADGARDDGAPFVLEVRGIPMIYRGEPHVLYIGRDVTEAKLAERALRASEEQYRAIFNATADAFVLRDAGFGVVDLNPAYEAMSGLKREEMLGQTRPLLKFAGEDDARRMALHRRALNGERFSLELDAERRDGSRFRLELMVSPMQYRGVPHVLYVGRDITERRQAEEALRASWEQYRAIFDATTDSLVLRDAQFRIVDVNPAYEAMSGRARAEALGRGDVTMSDPQMTARIQALHQRALAGEQVAWESVARRKGGESFHIEVRGVPIRHQGEPHVLYIGRDVTEAKAAERERAQLEAQLRQSQKMEAIGQLTGGIAHDFNNILQGILGNLVLAEERQARLADPKLGRHLERAHAASQRARDLIQQMLTFSRGQSGERRPVAAGALLEAATRLLRPTLPATIELETTLADGLPGALLDTVQFEQVLLNLCINSRDAMQGEGRIALAARLAEHRGAYCASCRQRVDGRFLEISVSDSGPGIPTEVRERMFDPFFSTKAAGKGSGMGLAMVHGIVHQHGGHVLVDSTPGAGAVFRVLIPPAAAPARAPAAHDAVPSRQARSQLSGRVLVADDEPAIRELLGEFLGDWGLEVVICADGVEARDAFAEDPQSFDLVLTDQTMPRLTGVQLAKLVSRMRPGIPVILCTGYGEDLKPRELEAAGVRTLARKPVEPAALRELVQAALQTRNKAPT